MKKIEMGKIYKTRSGLPVRVLCVDRPHNDYPVVALINESYQGGDVWSFTATGLHALKSDCCKYDLVEHNPWADVEIDAKIFVRNQEEAEWTPRHFAGVTDDGGVLAFNSGATSHSVGGGMGATVIWLCAKLA